MREIMPDEARTKHSVWTAHHETKPGGELRFRLSHSDGTRYIRTERPPGAGGEWQDAHFHRSVQETYIVQRGWIAFAEMIDGEMSVRVLKEGAIVTTQPLVHHNVYMAEGAVIHTVKHGAGQGEDKEPAPELNVHSQRLTSEIDINRFADSCVAKSKVVGNQTKYSDEYRHFDAMIWQMPGWSTAIFLGTSAVLAQANVDTLQKLFPTFSLSELTAGFLFIIFGFLLGLTQALYRFRIHQLPMKKYKPTKWWSSASTHLQLFVTAQAFVVLFLAISSITLPRAIVAFYCMAAFLALAVYRECAVRKNARQSSTKC